MYPLTENTYRPGYLLHQEESQKIGHKRRGPKQWIETEKATKKMLLREKNRRENHCPSKCIPKYDDLKKRATVIFFLSESSNYDNLVRCHPGLAESLAIHEFCYNILCGNSIVKIDTHLLSHDELAAIQAMVLKQEKPAYVLEKNSDDIRNHVLSFKREGQTLEEDIIKGRPLGGDWTVLFTNPDIEKTTDSASTSPVSPSGGQKKSIGGVGGDWVVL